MDTVLLPHFLKINQIYNRGNTDAISQINVYIKTIFINLQKYLIDE